MLALRAYGFAGHFRREADQLQEDTAAAAASAEWISDTTTDLS